MVVDIQSLFKEFQKEGIGLEEKYNFFMSLLMSYWDKNSDETNEQLLSRANAKILIVRMYDFYNKKEEFYDNMKESEKRITFTDFIHNELIKLG